MSDSSRQSDDFETAAKGSPEQVAEFDDHRRGFVGTVQHFLHVNPSLIPLIVLVAAIVIFGALLGSKFFSPFALTLILQQVQIVGIVASAPKPCDPDRRHRPERRCDHGDVIGCHGAVHLSLRVAAFDRDSVRSCRWDGNWGGERVPCQPYQAATIHCDPRHVANHSRRKFPVFAERNNSVQEIEEHAAILQLFGAKFNVGGAVFTVGVIFMLLLILGLAYALRHTAWGRARLCRRG